MVGGTNDASKVGIVMKILVFGREIKIVKIDKGSMDFYMRLTSFYSQFQAVVVNYNQTVKAIKTNFSEKRALILLRQLEKATFELVAIHKKVMEITAEFDKKSLKTEYSRLKIHPKYFTK